ncbi:MAG: prephenate dehydrogenase dimerization domain-containing protein [Pyrinomonadaceae bacterium]
MTRLASSSWSVWRDILASNSGPIADALNEYIETLASVRDELRREESNANSQLSEAQTLFNRLEGPP